MELKKGMIFVIPPEESPLNIVVLLKSKKINDKIVWTIFYYCQNDDNWFWYENILTDYWFNNHSQYLVEGKKQWN